MSADASGLRKLSTLKGGPPQEAPRHNPPGPEGGQRAGTKASPRDGPTRRERASLLRLRTGCVWTAARRYLKGCCASPACSRCGDPETLEHLLCTCPGLAKESSTVTTAYRRQGLPATTLEHLLFPSRPHLPALRSLADFLEETGIAAYH
ncbi:hypothetical protein HPB52_017312 [Rhipicephalus sanguineus]|uniref:Tick transposon n=1 Tax=Rhipicephalus sanguineus TaxID=34632 RepID=A0A9D4PP79_RHISA|nr:hypothetical protein HPB52_017312 [Rhipicephalus sanguineus]